MSELQDAETAMIKYLHSKYFCDFFSARTDKEQLKSLPTSLQKLRPYVHDSIVRIGGRLSQDNVAFDLKHLIILPPDSHLTELIILQLLINNSKKPKYGTGAQATPGLRFAKTFGLSRAEQLSENLLGRAFSAKSESLL